MIHGYLSKRETLVHTFLLIDSRHEVQKNDQFIMQWLIRQQNSFSVIMTKSDKVSKSQLSLNLKNLKSILGTDSLNQQIITTSSQNKSGGEEILALIQTILSKLGAGTSEK